MSPKSLLLQLSDRAIFASTEESEESFYQRAAAIAEIPTPSFPNLQKLYSIEPDWVQLIYSNDSLWFWEGGCTWEDKGKVTIQLRKRFEKRERLYFIYKRQELIEHEIIHAVRAPLESNYFEELFAYQTSAAYFRRALGPIISNPRESVYYMISWALFLITAPWPVVQLLCLLLNLGLLSYALLRLNRKTKLFFKVKRRVAQLVGEEKALAFMLRLTDEEMFFCASHSPQEMEKYFRERKGQNAHQAQIFEMLNSFVNNN